MSNSEDLSRDVLQIVSSTVDDLMSAPETIGVILHGSTVTGTTHADSDVDLICVTNADWCSKEVREVNARRAEIGRYPEREVRESLMRSTARNNNFMLNMLTTGRIVGDKDGRIALLVEEARRLRGQGPALPSPLEVAVGSAFLRDQLSDLRRLHAEGDPHGIGRALADMLLFRSVYAYCKTHGRWSTKFTLMFDRLRDTDPAFYALCADFSRATARSDQIAALEAILDAVLSPMGSVPVAYQTPHLPPAVIARLRAGVGSDMM